MEIEGKGKTRKENRRKKYVRLSIKEKCLLVQDIEEGMRKVDASKKYNIDKKAVAYILKNKDMYLNANGKNYLKKRSRIDKGQHRVMESALVEWIKKQWSQGITINGPMIREKASMINEELIKVEKGARKKEAIKKETKSTDSEEETNEAKDQSFELNKHEKKFKASVGWLAKFKARHGMREIRLAGEELSANTELADKAQSEIRQFLVDNEYSLDNVYNANETAILYKSLPAKTLAFAEEKCASGFKQNKESVTIMNCANATGSHKIPLLMIGKSAKSRCFRDAELPVNYASQSRSLMTEKLFVEWYETVFINAVKTRKLDENEKFLLILDKKPCHPSEEELNQIDPQFRVLFLPPNVTSLIQPMDQGIIECMRRNYKKIFLRRMLFDDKSRNIVNFVKSWTLIDTNFAVASAWEKVPEITISECWKKLLGDQAPVVKVSDPIVTDVTDLLNSVTSSEIHCNKDVEAWFQDEANLESCKNRTDEEIVENVFYVKNEIFEFHDCQSAIEDTKSSATIQLTERKKSNPKEAFENFLNFRAWLEENDQCSSDDIERLNQMQDLLERKLYDFMTAASKL